MAKQVSAVESDILDQARAYVHQASQLLKSLDPGRARVGWLLEDTLMYLDEMEADEYFDGIEPIELELTPAVPRPAMGTK